MGLFSQMVENDRANAVVVNAAYHRIIEADIASNYAPGTVSAVLTKHGFDVYKANGGQFFASDSTLIIYRDRGDQVEFHTANAGSARDLTECVVEFLKHVEQTYTHAVTYYDNERVTRLFKFVPYGVEIQRIDEGQDRTFKAAVSLKERI